MQTQIKVQEKEMQEQLEAKLVEVRAMPVVRVVSEDTSSLFSLMEILAKLAEQMDSGLVADDGSINYEGQVRIEQFARVVIFKRENGQWAEVVSARTVFDD